MTATVASVHTQPRLPLWRLTLWRLTLAQFRALFGGSATGWGIAAVILLSVVSGLIGALAGLSSPHPLNPLPAVNFAIIFASGALQLFAIAVGAEAIAGEFGWGTIGATLAVSPRRGVLFTAKTLATCGTVMVLGIVSGLLAGGTTLTMLALRGRPVDSIVVVGWLASTGGLALGAGVLALLAVALGALTRQRVSAILVPILVLFLLPVVVGFFFPGTVRDWVMAILPSTAFTTLASAHVDHGVIVVGSALPGAATVTVGTALLILVAWCAVVVPASVASFIRRDLIAVRIGSSQVLRKNPVRQHPVRQYRVQKHPDSRLFRSTAGGRFRSELRKSWSLPSVRWVIGIAILLHIISGVARASLHSVEGVASPPNILEALTIEYSFAVTEGIAGVTLVLAVLFAIQVAGEFETGTAVSTFIAAPRRWQVTSSKLFVAAIFGMLVGIPAVLITAIVTLPIYAARGYIATPEVVQAGLTAGGKAMLFLLLISLMSAGIAGIFRRSVTTVITVSVLLVIAPALFNTILGFSRATGAPLIAVGNVARFFPVQGAEYYLFPDGITDFAAIDGDGVLQFSAQFGIMITAFWAIAALIGWFIVDARRAITIR